MPSKIFLSLISLSALVLTGCGGSSSAPDLAVSDIAVNQLNTVNFPNSPSQAIFQTTKSMSQLKIAKAWHLLRAVQPPANLSHAPLVP
jgi:hypothetical protein